MLRNRFLKLCVFISFIVFGLIMAADVGEALQLLSYKVTPSTKPDVTDGEIAALADPYSVMALLVKRARSLVYNFSRSVKFGPSDPITAVNRPGHSGSNPERSGISFIVGNMCFSSA